MNFFIKESQQCFVKVQKNINKLYFVLLFGVTYVKGLHIANQRSNVKEVMVKTVAFVDVSENIP